MRILEKFVCIYLAALALTGCATLDTKRSVPQSAANSAESIGVVSTLGDEFNATWIGITIFNNKEHQFKVPDWGVDELAIEKAIQYLNSRTTYRADSLGSDYSSDGIDRMMDDARAAGHDKLIAITPGGYPNQPNYAEGYGLHRRTTIFGRTDCIYSLFVVQAYDVSTKKKLGWQWSFPGGAFSTVGCYGDGNLGTPWSDQTEWRESLDGYSESERALLRVNVSASVAESVPRAIKELGF